MCSGPWRSQKKNGTNGEKVNGPLTKENHAPAKEHLSFNITPRSLGPKGPGMTGLI